MKFTINKKKNRQIVHCAIGFGSERIKRSAAFALSCKRRQFYDTCQLWKIGSKFQKEFTFSFSKRQGLKVAQWEEKEIFCENTAL